jgi:uncharacterized membrane protein YhfC
MILQRVVSGSGMVLTGLLFVFIFKKRKKIRFIYIVYGALAWIVAIALKFAWALPVNKHIYSWLFSVLESDIAGPIFWVYVGLLTGIFECIGVYLTIRFTKLKKMSLMESYGFGYGFGCIESILLGLTQFAAIAAIITGQHQPGTIGWLSVPAPIIERIVTIFLHLFTTLLIIYSIKEHKPLFFIISFIYKSFIDTIAAWAQLSFGIDTLSHLWIVEGIVVFFSSFAIAGSILFLKKKSEST